MKRKECIKSRRLLQRLRKGKTDIDAERIEQAQDWYKERKRTLTLAILKAKERKWKEVVEAVEENIWGTGYKIVRKKMKPAPPKIGDQRRTDIIHKLFPRKDPIERKFEVVDVLEMVKEEEIKDAARKLKTGKAPGPDQIPIEATVLCANALLGEFAEAMNNMFLEGIFPKSQKEARLVLIEKPKQDGALQIYRPLCLLNGMSKMIEHVIRARLERVIQGNRNLSSNQFGFVRGKSTLHAVRRVVDTARKEMAKSRRTRQLCALITFDIANAFNSASWHKILKALRERDVDAYLINIISSYLYERDFVDTEGYTYSMECGVPQGSVLGPLLWNILYDGILHLKVPEGAELIAYADDLALLVLDQSEASLESKVNRTAERIIKWLNEHDLELAAHKTECVMLSGRRKHRPVTFRVGGKNISPSNNIKYLGIQLDSCLNFAEHINRVAAKAEGVTKQLARLMPRTYGASEQRRKILAGVAQSMTTYGIEVWRSALKTTKYRRQLERVQRCSSLCVIRGYRTIGLEASRVLASCIPIDLLADERSRQERGGISKKENRRKTIEAWNARWQEHDGSKWLKTLLPNLQMWVERKVGSITFHTTQALTGHGCFREFLYRIKKATSPICLYCNAADDTPEHTFMHCCHWHTKRKEAEDEIKIKIESDTIIKVMIESERKNRMKEKKKKKEVKKKRNEIYE